MKIKNALLIGAASLQLSVVHLFALTVELYNISDGKGSSKIDFGVISPRQGHLTAQQFHKISYPEIESNKEIHIYTETPNLSGSNNTERSGLVTAGSMKDRIPLYWLDFSSPSATVRFTQGDESSWKLLIDRSHPDFEQKKNETMIPLQSGGISYLYLGAKIPGGVASGQYRTKIIFEVLSLNTDIKAPSFVQAPSQDQFFVSERISFQATIEDDVQIASATFFYRYEGEMTYQSLAMNLKQNMQNPFQFSAEAVLPSEQRKTGTLEYYIVATDGSNRAFIGNTTEPKRVKIVNDFAEKSQNLNASGGKFKIFQEDSSASATELIFPEGSVKDGEKISARKIQSQTLPMPDGKQSIAAYEFGPHGLQFQRPVTFKIAYADQNQDGVVDGTDVREEDLKVFWNDGIEWRLMGGEVDKLANVASIPLYHFSVYGLFNAGALSATDVRPKEKIITPNGDGKNDFAQFGISGDFQIGIYDVNGRKVKKIEGNSVWDGKGENGEVVESGVYIYQVKSSQIDVTGSIGVAR